MAEKRLKCVVLDGRFVEPCQGMESATDNFAPGFSRTKGIFRRELTNFKTRQPSRSYYGIISNNHKNGLLFNFCPWCGVEIDAPFKESN